MTVQSCRPCATRNSLRSHRWHMPGALFEVSENSLTPDSWSGARLFHFIDVLNFAAIFRYLEPINCFGPDFADILACKSIPVALVQYSVLRVTRIFDRFLSFKKSFRFNTKRNHVAPFWVPWLNFHHLAFISTDKRIGMPVFLWRYCANLVSKIKKNQKITEQKNRIVLTFFVKRFQIWTSQPSQCLKYTVWLLREATFKWRRSKSNYRLLGSSSLWEVAEFIQLKSLTLNVNTASNSVTCNLLVYLEGWTGRNWKQFHWALLVFGKKIKKLFSDYHFKPKKFKGLVRYIELMAFKSKPWFH